jgi:Papain-like cysteine protease AvrRpt2
MRPNTSLNHRTRYGGPSWLGLRYAVRGTRYIFAARAKPSHRSGPISSNVRRHIRSPHTHHEEPMSYVHYEVPGIIQGSSNTCWLACLRMLAMYQIQAGRQLNAHAAALMDPAAVARFESLNRAQDPARFEEIAVQFGLAAMHAPGLTRALRPGELADPLLAFDILRRRGPFILGGLLLGVSGHAIVICGGRDEPPDFLVEFIDPRFGNIRQLALQTLQTAFPPDGSALFVF